MFKKKIKLGFIIGLVVSLFSLFWIYHQFDFKQIIHILKNTNFSRLSLLPLLILASFGLRAQRWKLLVNLNAQVSFWPAFSAQMIGYLFNNILPARAGDILRGVELARTTGLSKAKVLTSLIIERVFELTFIVVLLGLVLITYPKLPAWLHSSGYVMTALSFCGLAFLLFLHMRGRSFLRSFILSFSHRLPKNSAHRFAAVTSSILDGVEHALVPGQTLMFFLLTGLIWLAEILIVLTVAMMVGLPLALGNALFMLLILAIGLMVPSSPGFVGTYEFFGIAALNLIGIQGEIALSFVLLLHVVSLLGSTLLGVCCLLLRQLKHHR